MADDFEARMTFTEHLGELRTRIVRSLIAVTAAFFLCFFLSGKILEVVAAPLRSVEEITVNGEQAKDTADSAGDTGDEEPKEEEEESSRYNPFAAPKADFVSLGPLEPFLVRFKVAAYAGLVLAFPYLLYQLCAFIFPGLRPAERSAAKILIVGCGLLASMGVVVAYFGVFPLVLPYLLQYNPDWVTTQLQLDQTVSIIIKGLLGFSVAFQFPMAVIILVYLGVLEPKTLKQYRKIAIVALAFVSALFTPPDPFSMLILMIPMVLLYEISILLSYLVIRRKRQKADAPEGNE
ncbi:MAG: twin-arginine translocase subunit TatC [Candidatus Hydrogenedentota bacterium]